MKKIMICIALVTISLTACDNKKESTKESGALPIDVAEPVVKNVVLTKDYPGYIDAESSVNIMARVSGVLNSVNYKEGQRVKKGDLLFVIEPDLYEDAVQQAEAALKTACANLEYARSNYTRMKEAIKSDAVSRIQFLQAESNVTTSEAAVSSARAALSTAKLNLSYCYIKSPTDGVADLAIPSTGGYVNGGVSPVLMTTVYKNNTMYVYFNIADNQYLSSKSLSSPGTLPKDYAVNVSIGDDSIYNWKAHIDYFSPTVTQTTGTLRIRAALANKGGILRKGMYVTISLPYGEKNNALLISDASISTDQLGKYIYVVNDSDVVKYRPIKTGQLFNNMRIVTSGLKPNEKYVTKALLKVRDGMKIMPVMPNQKSDSVKKTKK